MLDGMKLQGTLYPRRLCLETSALPLSVAKVFTHLIVPFLVRKFMDQFPTVVQGGKGCRCSLFQDVDTTTTINSDIPETDLPGVCSKPFCQLYLCKVTCSWIDTRSLTWLSRAAADLTTPCMLWVLHHQIPFGNGGHPFVSCWLQAAPHPTASAHQTQRNKTSSNGIPRFTLACVAPAPALSHVTCVRRCTQWG